MVSLDVITDSKISCEVVGLNSEGSTEYFDLVNSNFPGQLSPDVWLIIFNFHCTLYSCSFREYSFSGCNRILPATCYGFSEDCNRTIYFFKSRFKNLLEKWKIRGNVSVENIEHHCVYSGWRSFSNSLNELSSIRDCQNELDQKSLPTIEQWSLLSGCFIFFGLILSHVSKVIEQLRKGFERIWLVLHLNTSSFVIFYVRKAKYFKDTSMFYDISFLLSKWKHSGNFFIVNIVLFLLDSSYVVLLIFIF